MEEEVTRENAVSCFIAEYESIFKGTMVWEALIEDSLLIGSFIGGVIANDIHAKMILSHEYGEEMAKFFKHWFVALFPCEDDMVLSLKEEVKPMIHTDGYTGPSTAIAMAMMNATAIGCPGTGVFAC